MVIVITLLLQHAEHYIIFVRCIHKQRFFLKSTLGLQGMENKDLPLPLPEEDGAAKEAVKRGYKPLDHPFRIAWI